MTHRDNNKQMGLLVSGKKILIIVIIIARAYKRKEKTRTMGASLKKGER